MVITYTVSNNQTISLINSFIILLFYMNPDSVSTIISDITDLPL